MNTPSKIPAPAILVVLILNASVLLAIPSGFNLPDPNDEVSMQYTTINNLIILPVTINGNLRVNLILDTGTRNIVLFGKRFQNLFQFHPERTVQFSGMGNGKPVNGKISLDNRVELTTLIGEKIPLVVVFNKNIFKANPKIDGIIGYDLFMKFEIEIDPKQKLITFRSPSTKLIPAGFTRIPMRIENTKPIVDSNILLEGGAGLHMGLLIDTGSQLSFLLKTTNNELLTSHLSEVLGKGISGTIEGIKTTSQTVCLSGMHFQNQPTGIILSPWHNYGSIGMGVLKGYAMIINYNGQYACFKKL